MNKIVRVIVASGALVGSSLAIALPGSAAPGTAGESSGVTPAAWVCSLQGSDKACVNGSRAQVCDREADGRGVYGEFITRSGRTRFGDANGSASPCAYRTIKGITKFRVNETRTGPDLHGPWKRP